MDTILISFHSEFMLNFDESHSENIGAGVITRVIQHICKTKNAIEMTRGRCSGFMIYPPHEFYPMEWRRWHWIFNPLLRESILSLTKNSLAFHIWDKMVSKSQIYGFLAKKNCPNVYVMTEDYF